MLISRPLSAVGGLLVLVVLSRLLPTAEYGIYFAVWAIVEILILSSNLGLLHAAYRYVSASEWSDGSIHLQGPVWKLLAWRIVSLLFFSTALLALPPVTTMFSDKYLIAAELLPFIAVIALAEGLARYLETLFDSMLFQGRSQLTLLSRTLLRLFGLTYFLLSDSLTLKEVIYAELSAATIGASIGIFLLWNLHRKASKKTDRPDAEKISIARMTRFALPAYVAQVLGLTYGPDALKLALGTVAGASAIATFGFAYSLAAVAQRYMPANILSGIFRPIFVAVFRKPDAEKLLSDLLNVSIKLNWAFILPVFCFLYFGGTPLLSKLSGGHYANAGMVAAWLVLGLMAVAIHLNLSMYCLAKENAWPPLLATATSMVGLPIGYVLAQHFGAVGIAAAFGLSELIWSVVCFLALQMGLRRNVNLDWTGFLKLLGIAIGALAICSLFSSYFASLWLLPAILTPAIFLFFAWSSGAFSAQEKIWLMSVLPVDKVPFVGRRR